MSASEIMLLGGPNSGKTHYAGQLYGRVQRNPGRLRLRKDGTPSDLGPLQEVLDCLENGRAAQHTPTGTSHAVILPLIAPDGRCIDLRWPDYGGEQLSQIEAQRAVPEAWRSRLVAAGGWIVLIRIGAETVYTDALEKLVGQHDQPNRRLSERAERWDANARWVELLQILLHIAGHGTAHPLRHPRLAVLLSCFDELNIENRSPPEVLAERLPLLAAFIEANWASRAYSVWGLSALGKLLDQHSDDDAFVNEGPEWHGWVAPPDGGEHDADLSRPIAWLLDAE